MPYMNEKRGDPQSQTITASSGRSGKARTRRQVEVALLQNRRELEQAENRYRTAARIESWSAAGRFLLCSVPGLTLLLAAWTIWIVAPSLTSAAAVLLFLGVAYGFAMTAAIYGYYSSARAENRLAQLKLENRRLLRARKSQGADRARVKHTARRRSPNQAPAAEPSSRVKRRGSYDVANLGKDLQRAFRAGARMNRGLPKLGLPKSLRKSMGGSGRSAKWKKLLTRKTWKGKTNILIDMLFHGKGKAGYAADELLHILNERNFSTYKFLKYGNARRLLGRSGASMLRVFWKFTRSLKRFM